LLPRAAAIQLGTVTTLEQRFELMGFNGSRSFADAVFLDVILLHYHTSGTGHLYQGRFKAFPVETDEHSYTVLRYVERNPVRPTSWPAPEQWREKDPHREQHPKSDSRLLAQGGKRRARLLRASWTGTRRWPLWTRNGINQGHCSTTASSRSVREPSRLDQVSGAVYSHSERK
jgi:hypothetical protein